MSGQELADKLFIHSPYFAHLAVFVILLFSISEVSYGGINEYIPRSGIEVEQCVIELAISVWRNEANVGDSTNILPIIWLLYPETAGRPLEEVSLIFTSDSPLVSESMEKYRRRMEDAGDAPTAMRQLLGEIKGEKS